MVKKLNLRTNMLTFIVLIVAAIIGLTALEVQAAPATWTVQRGDTLYSISQATGVSVDNLATWNGITNAMNLLPGQALRLEPPVAGQPQAGAQTGANSATSPAVQPPATNKQTTATDTNTSTPSNPAANIGKAAESALNKASDALSNLTKKGGPLDAVLNLFQKDGSKAGGNNTSDTGIAGSAPQGGANVSQGSGQSTTTPSITQPSSPPTGGDLTKPSASGTTDSANVGVDSPGQPQSKSWSDTILGWAKSYGWIAILGLLKIIGII